MTTTTNEVEEAADGEGTASAGSGATGKAPPRDLRWPLPWRAALRLGRVSNLPTVWSNVIAAAILAGAEIEFARLGVLLAAATLFYLGGMFLNDAFDAEIDAAERAVRPIPAGEVSIEVAFGVGFGLLALAVALSASLGAEAGLLGIALAGAILAYDAWHKKTVAAPALMGACRALLFLLGGFAMGGTATVALLAGAAGLFTHVVGLTFAAKQEAYDRLERVWPLGVLALAPIYALWACVTAPGSTGLWAGLFLLALIAAVLLALRRLIRRAPGDVPVAVVTLIAAMSLFDATLLATADAPGAALFAALCFGATLWLQRLAPGT